MNVVVESELRQALDQYRTISEGLREKAITRALNRVGDQAATLASRRIAEEYSFKVREVKATIKVRRAARGRLEVTISSRGRRTPLIQLSARQTSTGVSVRIKRTRHVITGAFIARMRSGHEGAYKREGKTRLPIRERYTIAIPEAFRSTVIVKAMEQAVRDLLPKRIEHELAYLIGKGDA